MWRKCLRGLGCLAYLGVLAVIFGLVAYVSFSQFVRRGVTALPELEALAETEARALLADSGLTLKVDQREERFDEKVPEGHVLLQRPGAGTLVRRGSQVEVILSRGPQQIEVPSVLGVAPQAAQVMLAAAGLSLGRTLNIYSPLGPRGTVVSQQPPVGSMLKLGGTVELFISVANPKEVFVMPDLIDRDYETVRRFFERHGFRLGRVGYETYPGRAPGTVVQQYPLSGHPLHRGEVVSLGVVAPEPEVVLGQADSNRRRSFRP